MRPVVNDPNGPTLVQLVELCVRLNAEIVALHASVGDAARAAATARRSVHIVRAHGLLVEEKS